MYIYILICILAPEKEDKHYDNDDEYEHKHEHDADDDESDSAESKSPWKSCSSASFRELTPIPRFQDLPYQATPQFLPSCSPGSQTTRTN